MLGAFKKVYLYNNEASHFVSGTVVLGLHFT